MTVTTQSSRMPPYAGNGSATQFPVSFPFPNAESIRAVLERPGQEDADLVLDTDFTVSGAGEPGGGTLAFPKAGSAYGVLAAGESLHILRILALTQERGWDNVDAIDAEEIEAGDDRLTMVCQQLQEQLDRAVLWPVTETDPGVDAGDYMAGVETARDAAQAAQAGAETARAQAQAAQSAAQGAQVAAAASQSAAASSASSAGTSATGASASASAAAGSAASASGSAATAATQAAAAAGSAAQAQTARDAAENAQNAAEDARAAAGNARDAALVSEALCANYAAAVIGAVDDYGTLLEAPGETLDYGGLS